MIEKNVEKVLLWNGISPPIQNSKKTTCPICSAGRLKKDEKCMVVNVKHDRVELYCYHCEYNKVEQL